MGPGFFRPAQRKEQFAHFLRREPRFRSEHEFALDCQRLLDSPHRPQTSPHRPSGDLKGAFVALALPELFGFLKEG